MLELSQTTTPSETKLNDLVRIKRCDMYNTYNVKYENIIGQ